MIDVNAGTMAVFILVGLIVAFPCSMVGLGGGIIFIPVLVLVFRLPPGQATAISLFAMLGNTLSCSVTYIRQRRVNFKLALIYDIMDVPGVFFGAWLTVILARDLLLGIMGAIIFTMGVSLMRRSLKGTTGHDEGDRGFGPGCGAPTTAPPETGEGKEIARTAPPTASETGTGTGSAPEATPASEPAGRRPGNDASGAPPGVAGGEAADTDPQAAKVSSTGLAILSSFLSGLVSGLAGVGGGTTDTTTMILLGVPPHVAGPTSEFAMAFTNIVAVVTHGALGNILWAIALPMMFGAIVGAQVGARLSKRVNADWLLRILICFALFSSVLLFLTALGVIAL